MMSRAFTAKPRKNFRHRTTTYGRSKSASVSEYDDYSSLVVGLMEDMPLVQCGHGKSKFSTSSLILSCGLEPTSSSSTAANICGDENYNWAKVSLKVVLRASVGVLGVSRVGMTEKVVLYGGKMCVLKRLGKPSVGKVEFGKRVERFAHVSRMCEYLVPFRAYLYAKRIKFVVSDYYPMGSLADLLAGSRQHGHTALEWDQRLTIVLHIARAIDFIHKLSPAQEKGMKLNVHGNIKASNVIISTDFSACLSDYGTLQLADQRVEFSESWQWNKGAAALVPPEVYLADLCQKCDVFNFGVTILDMLGGPEGTNLVMSSKLVLEIKEKIVLGEIEFFEFPLEEGKEWTQASQVLDIALACTNRSPEARPLIQQILLHLEDGLVGRPVFGRGAGGFGAGPASSDFS
ncbi:probable inactive receptor kinase At3g08680 [Humulus lupulus]|uniref:probable inactive receptor kinase At3g08680 n=1 Tax=Humulus lupulus TaxID=3486 RepID=UPI002B414A08|nr:probable inactive receptor kinase At3g08680 [Humulus lupulus]